MASVAMSIDTHHDDMIHDAQLDYYAKRLATCSSDRTIKMYDVSGDAPVHVADLGGHDGPVWQVAWAHPKFGSLLASCSYDKKVIVHRESPSGEWVPVFTYSGHIASVNALAWAPHEYGLVLASASSDGSVAVMTHQPDDSWDVKTITDCRLGVNSVSWAPYGALGSKVDGSFVKRLITGGCDSNVAVWAYSDAEREWRREKTLSQHSDWVRDVAWAPSTGIPVNIIASCSEDASVYIWTQEEAGGEWEAKLLHTFDAPVWRVSWSITGNILAVSSGDNTVTLWSESLDRKWVQISSVSDAPAGKAAS
eukprot:PLAT4785.1.p1 GENE.PLAT4785.1~~PLAT4785.1.p1  ORF type:complete len:308 (-),score=119.74 PLAT4785.1:98-1021(-)